MVEYSFLTGLIAGNLTTYIFGEVSFLVGIFIIFFFSLSLYRMGASADVIGVIMFPLVLLLAGWQLIPEQINLLSQVIVGTVIFVGLLTLIIRAAI